MQTQPAPVDRRALASAYETALGIRALAGGKFLAEEGWTAEDYQRLASLADRALRSGSFFADGQSPALDCLPLHQQRAQRTARLLHLHLDCYTLSLGKETAFEWLEMLIAAPVDVIVHMEVSARAEDGLQTVQDYTAIVGAGAALAWAAGLTIGEAIRDREVYSTDALMVLAAARGFTFLPS